MQKPPDSKRRATQVNLRPLPSQSAGYPIGWQLSLNIGEQSYQRTLLQLKGEWKQPACRPFRTYLIQKDWQPIGELRTRAYLMAPGIASQHELVRLPGVEARQPVLSSAVASSFQRLRERLLANSGYDYLGVLNDAWRGLDHPGGQLLSWHRAGRAFDVRDWFATDRQRLYITREQLGAQTYFRIYLLTQVQDGSRGRPLRESIWLTDGRKSDAEMLRNGGRYAPPPTGYFVDFTDLAAREHWTRIPGLTAPSGDWRINYLDMEFWHYERRDGLRWYEAMGEIYGGDDLDARYSPSQLLGRGYTTSELQRAGILPVEPDPPCLISAPHGESVSC